MEVLKEAYFNTKYQGSSTACILTLTCDIVHAVNVGDSGFVVIREGGIVYKSEIQQKRFNCPFQLGNDDKSDDPSVAQEIMVPVKTGDVIVMASDGLWDNVHDYELEKLVRDRLVDLREMGTFSKMLARKIAEYAQKNSETVPFSYLNDGDISAMGLGDISQFAARASVLSPTLGAKSS
ncbi:hypothetical protein HAX54_014598 [Datura stramonium]|uniref:Protein phosphatase n=1 Tax=Datura stramonium TaxID=4076 RepID=A0ABS8RZ23_DATST|nr:hypothetical protein [Datura stramonium]